MIYIFAIVALLIGSMTVYKIMNPTRESVKKDYVNDSEAIIMPREEPFTGRKVAKWLPPCNARTVGHCGSPMNCCGCLYPDTVS